MVLGILYDAYDILWVLFFSLIYTVLVYTYGPDLFFVFLRYSELCGVVGPSFISPLASAMVAEECILHFIFSQDWNSIFFLEFS